MFQIILFRTPNVNLQTALIIMIFFTSFPDLVFAKIETDTLTKNTLVFLITVRTRKFKTILLILMNLKKCITHLKQINNRIYLSTDF